MHGGLEGKDGGIGVLSGCSRICGSTVVILNPSNQKSEIRLAALEEFWGIFG